MLPNNLYEKVLEEFNSIQSEVLSNIINKTSNKVDYSKEKPEENFEMLEAVSKRERWPYYGILSSEKLARLSLLEHLLNKDSSKVHNYPTWKKS